MTKTRDLADLGGGFIQAGTGAVQRTVESKLQDVVSIKDFGAVGNGSDETAIIAAAIAATPTGGVLVIPPGTYGISVLQITRSNITILLQGQLSNVTTLSPPPQLHTGAPSYGAPPNEISNYPAILLNGCSNIKIEGTGSIYTPWYEAIKAINCSKLSIHGIKISGQRETNLSSYRRGAWDGIWMTGCSDVEIDSVEIYNIGGIRQAVLDQRWSGNPNGVSGNCVTINSSTRVRVTNCYFHDYAWYAVYPMDTTKGQILNNVAENGAGFCQYNALGDYSVTPLDYIIDGNMIRNMSANGLDLSVGSAGVTRANARITNNTFKYCGYLPDMAGQFDGAYISVNVNMGNGYITGFVFDGNTMEEGCTDYGVYLSYVHNCIFSNNTVVKTGKMAFQLQWSANILITNNILQEIGTNFITLASGSANPYIVAEGNIINMAGWPIAYVGGSTANGLKMINNRFLVESPVSIDLNAASNSTWDANYFGAGMTVTLTGNNVTVDKNIFEETTTLRLTTSSVSSNTFIKGLTLPGVIETTITGNIVNKSKGPYNLSVFASNGVTPTKLAVTGNIFYANSGNGTTVYSEATNSVWVNVSPNGTVTNNI